MLSLCKSQNRFLLFAVSIVIVATPVNLLEGVSTQTGPMPAGLAVGSGKILVTPEHKDDEGTHTCDFSR